MQVHKSSLANESAHSYQNKKQCPIAGPSSEAETPPLSVSAFPHPGVTRKFMLHPNEHAQFKEGCLTAMFGATEVRGVHIGFSGAAAVKRNPESIMDRQSS